MSIKKKNVTCHTSNQRVLQLSSHHILATPAVHSREIQDGGNRILALDHYCTHQGNDCSESRPLCLPSRRKVLNSFTWDVWAINFFKLTLVFWCSGFSWWLNVLKNLPAMQEPQEMQVQSLDWEDSLEEDMMTHSSILSWRIPKAEEPGGLQSMGSLRIRHNWSDLTCKGLLHHSGNVRATLSCNYFLIIYISQ